MPALTRLGDICTGHGAFPPRASVAGSPDVFCNGIAVHRVGDGWAVHCDPNSCHPGSLAAGSSTVFVNGKAAGRVGDEVNCGSVVAAGSGDVFAGG